MCSSDLGGIKTEYLHLDEISVVSDQEVRRGDMIGKSGGRGKDKKTGEYKDDAFPFHLHFGVISENVDKDMKDGEGNDVVYSSFGKKEFINPSCFFDISQFKIDSSSKACGKCHDTNSCKLNEGPQKWCDLYGIKLPSQKEEKQTGSKAGPQSPADQKTITLDFSSGAVSCKGADWNLISTTRLKYCSRYLDIFKDYLDKYRDKVGFDLLFLLAWVSAENEPCSTNLAGGLMQVDNCKTCHTPPQPENQVREGFEEYMSKKDYLDKEMEGLSDGDKLIFLLFAYNRGETTAKKAINYYKEDNLMEAMTKACFDVFGDAKDAKGNLKCQHYGYAALYPQKIFDRYKEACEQMGGTPTAEEYTSPAKIIDSIGEYTFTPAFRLEVDYDLGVYDRVYKVLKAKNEEYIRDGVDPKEIIRKIEESPDKELGGEFRWSTDCDEDDKKAFYAFAEQYYLCANNTEPKCFCEIKMPQSIPSVSRFEIARDGRDTIFKYGKNAEIKEVIKGKIPEFPPSILSPNDKNADVKIEKQGNDYYSFSIMPTGAGRASTHDYGNIGFDESFLLYKDGESISFISPS